MTSMTLSRKVTSVLAAAAALAGVSWGVSAQAATVPPGTSPRAVVHLYNPSGHPQWYKLQSMDPVTGRYVTDPLGHGAISHVRWTYVTPTEAGGSAEWNYSYLGLCVNAPASIIVYGQGSKYGTFSVNLDGYWVTDTKGKYACPPDGHGQAYTNQVSFLVIRQPTLDIRHFS